MSFLCRVHGVTEDWTNRTAAVKAPREREKCDIPNVAAALQFAESTRVLLFQLLNIYIRMPAKSSRDMLFFVPCVCACVDALKPRARGTKRNERPPANN